MKLVLALFLLITFAFSLSPTWRLIEIHGNRIWMTKQQIEAVIHNFSEPTKIIDVTDLHKLKEGPVIPQMAPFPEKPRRQEIVNPLLPKIEKESVEYLTNTIKHLQSYGNRYAYDKTGVESAIWIRDAYQKMIDELPLDRRNQFTVQLFNHTGGWPQPSVIVTWKGKSEETVILGAHLDSVRVAPGADDNGSGTASVMETFRILANSDWTPERTVEFHGYAAEELGLRGSQEIVASYRRAGRKIYAMMNIDMNGYNTNNQIAVDISSSVAVEITKFLRTIIKEYCTIPSFDRRYFGGSDNHSWKAAGYQSCMAFENTVNPHWHRSTDTIDKIDIKYIKEWVRMATGFIIELA